MLDRILFTKNCIYKVQIREMHSPVFFSMRVIEITFPTRKNNKQIIDKSNEFNEFNQQITEFYAKNFTPCENIKLGSTYIARDKNDFHRCIAVEEM